MLNLINRILQPWTIATGFNTLEFLDCVVHSIIELCQSMEKAEHVLALILIPCYVILGLRHWLGFVHFLCHQ